MQAIFFFVMVSLVSAVAGSVATSMLGEVSVGHFGVQWRVDRVVMAVTMVGSLLAAGIAVLLALTVLYERATTPVASGDGTS